MLCRQNAKHTVCIVKPSEGNSQRERGMEREREGAREHVTERGREREHEDGCATV